MDVRLWGPHAWEFLHAATFGYPENPTSKEQAKMKCFFECLPWILPCKSCQQHFAQLLVTSPIDPHLGSREALTIWLVEAHNMVNTRLGKPTLSYDFVRDKYHGMRGTCRTEVHSSVEAIKDNRLICSALVIAIVMLCIVLWKYRNNAQFK